MSKRRARIIRKLSLRRWQINFDSGANAPFDPFFDSAQRNWRVIRGGKSQGIR